MVVRVVDMFNVADIVNRRSKDEAGKKNADSIGGLFRLDVFPDS